ncbi:MAG TPA: hypothetical protein VD978_04655 [Azospirillum sp.]|nr:hypothetical protein [Azospirillum sp.]
MNTAVLHPTPRSDASVLCVVVLVAAACVLALVKAPTAAWVVAGSSVILIGLEWQRIPRQQACLSAGAAAVGLMLMPFVDHPLVRLSEGLGIGSTFVALMASVSLLAGAARRSPAIHGVAQHLLGRDSRQGELSLVVAAHLFPALLNFAGSVLLCEMAAANAGAQAAVSGGWNRAVFGAIHRGFAAAACWSPMFGNLALLLTLYPGLDWPDIAPFGLAAGLLCSLTSLAVGPSRRPTAGRQSGVLQEVISLGHLLAPLLVGMGVFLSASLLLHHALSFSVAVAIIMLAPVFGMMWHCIDAGSLTAAAERLRDDARASLPRMAPEALFFACIGIMASMIGGAVPVERVADAVQPLVGSPALGILFLLTCNLVLSLLGIHPVMTALFLATALPPSAIGLAPLPHILAITVGYSIAFSVSPFTILATVIARYSQGHSFQVSWQWNRAFAGLMLLLGFSLLWLLSFALG